MNINPNNIDLIISAVQEAHPDTGLSEVALSGRSNVGKSFINSMIGRKYGSHVATTRQNTNIKFL